MIPKSSQLPSARKGSLKPAQITGYLAGAVGTAALIGAPQAEAAVTAVTFGFGPAFTASDGSYQWSVGPGFGSLYGAWFSGPSSPFVYFGLFPQSNLGQVYANDGYGRVNFFANSTVIGAGGNGVPGKAYFSSPISPSYRFTSDQLNKNIAFRTGNPSTGYRWGWANVDWVESTKTLKINGAFIESSVNTPITINESLLAPAPEPSRALLALAGLGGVALRRRRKQAA